MPPRIVVVGLGPGGPDLVTAGTLDAIAATTRRFLRTDRHPAATVVTDAETCDDLYESADAHRGRVPGHRRAAGGGRHGRRRGAVRRARLAERRRAHGRAAASATPASRSRCCRRSRSSTSPGPGSASTRWRWASAWSTATGSRSTRRASGDRCSSASATPATSCPTSSSSVDDAPSTPVVVLQRLGLPDESITTVDWFDLDREVEPDHLTSLYVPELAVPVAGELQRFAELVRVLREQCPWDARADPPVARPVPAGGDVRGARRDRVGRGRPIAPRGGAGRPAVPGGVPRHDRRRRRAAFTLADVARGIHDKLEAPPPPRVRRRGGRRGRRAADDLGGDQKRAEKGRASAMDGLTESLPAVLYAEQARRKAERPGRSTAPSSMPGDRCDGRGRGRPAGRRRPLRRPRPRRRAAARRPRRPISPPLGASDVHVAALQQSPGVQGPCGAMGPPVTSTHPFGACS